MKPKKKFIAVIGDQHSGKSTIIQALTGCGSRNFRGQITDAVTGKWIEVIASSPQEKHMPDFPKKMRAAMAHSMSLGVVIALQPNRPRKRLSIEDILQIAEEYRALLCYAFVISQPYKHEKLNDTDIDKIKGRLRNFRIENPIQLLDARRFAHVNASAIRDIVGWF